MERAMENSFSSQRDSREERTRARYEMPSTKQDEQGLDYPAKIRRSLSASTRARALSRVNIPKVSNT